MSRVLVTGCTGFVGAHLCDALARAGHEVRGAMRAPGGAVRAVAEPVYTGDIGPDTDWRDALRGVDAVVHLAGRAHDSTRGEAARTACLHVNAYGTRTLVQAASIAGVAHFVYLSSIKVNGETTEREPFTSRDQSRPQDAYGLSKSLGEEYVRSAAAAGMRASIVRPPLVYGPGVKANFLRLMNWIDAGVPLPFGAVRNRRSLISVWNLADFILAVLAGGAVSAGTWLVSDGEDLSTPDLIRRLGAAMGRTVRVPAVPPRVLRALGTITGRAAEVSRLCDSLVADIGPARQVLGWAPPTRVDDALERTARWYAGVQKN